MSCQVESNLCLTFTLLPLESKPPSKNRVFLFLFLF
jgi:hypothetical protein